MMDGEVSSRLLMPALLAMNLGTLTMVGQDGTIDMPGLRRPRLRSTMVDGTSCYCSRHSCVVYAIRLDIDLLDSPQYN